MGGYDDLWAEYGKGPVLASLNSRKRRRKAREDQHAARPVPTKEPQ